ncbi:MAG: hypothetical protein HZB16_07605 [Armatimonadetes bacterium]|nr:hypothetical protein [Armatimonadota bacterium]
MVLVALSFGWALGANRAFVHADQRLAGSKLNDVDEIYRGYHAAPDLWRDGLRWWSGVWIQSGIDSWRPVSSYVYWIDCYLGEHVGRWTWGWVGLFYLLIEAWAAAWLAWRLTRWVPAAALAGLLLPLQCRLASGFPRFWLYWFPVHQEIVTAAAVLVTLALFDTWLERGGGVRLACFWLAFLLACATKETCFILPGLLAAFAAWRRFPESPVLRRTVWLMVGALCVAVVGLWLWRAACVPHPRNPSIKLVQIPRKMGLMLLCPIWRYGLGGEWGVGVAPITATGVYYWWKARRPRWFVLWPVAWAAVMVPIYLWPGKGMLDVLLTLFDRAALRRDWFEVLCIVWAVLLFWRYRRAEQTMAIVACVVLIYVPNIDFIGWHYEVVPWGIRVVCWAVLAKLAWLYLVDEGHGARAWARLGEMAHHLAQKARPTPA